MQCKIRCKLIFLILIIYLPIFLSFVHFYLDIKKQIREEAIQSHQHIAKGIKNKVEVSLNNIISILTSLSEHNAVIGKKIKDCDRLFARVITTCQFCLNILLADVNGNNIGSAINPEKAHSLNYLDKDWFVKGMRGEIVINPPHISKLFNVHTFMITHPVSSGGKQIAVLGIPVNLTKISEELIDSYKLSRDTNVIIVNDAGQIMFNYKNSEAVGISIDKDGVFKNIFLKDTGYLYKNEHVAKSLVVFDTFEKFGWKVIIETNEDAILSGISDRLRNNFLQVLVLFGLSFFITFRLSKSINKRFDLLLSGINSFGKGCIRFRFNTDEVKDEFNNVFSTFNQMADNIYRYELEVNKLSRLYKLLSDANKKIIRCGDVEILQRDIARDIIETGGYKISFIAEKDKEKEGFKIACYYGCSAETAKDFESVINDQLVKVSLIKRFEKAEPFYKNELLKPDDPFEEKLLNYGFDSYCLLPVYVGESLHGILAVVSNSKNIFIDVDVELLKELALDLGFAIKSIRVNEEKQKIDELLMGVFESMGEGLAILDEDLNILSANRKYAEILEMSREEIINKKCFEVFCYASHQHICNDKTCDVKPIFEDGIERSKYIKRLNKKGEAQNLNIKFYPLKIKDRVKYIIKVVNDITDYKKLEDQYLHAQKMEAIGRLTAGISHDFNNILTGIIGFASLAEMITTDEEQKKNLRNIIELSEKGGNLTKSLLAFSRKTEYSPKIVNANELLMGYEKILKRLLGEQIELKYELTPKPLTVYVDPVQFEQIIMNLATNAMDAMQTGGSLLIKTEKVSLDDRFISMHGFGRKGDFALITFTDTGVGIPKEYIDKIFEPFFTTKEVGKGTGLGLSVVYGIVKNHDGFINVYSEEGKGASFKIYFPIVKGRIDVSESADDEKYKPLHIRAMILDDEEVVREPLRIALQNLGLNVVSCYDGFEALELIKKEKFDLIITDIVMSNMSGKEFYEKARQIDQNIRFIFISGYPADFISEKYEIDLNSVVMKPVSPNYLYRKIREILGKA